MEIDVEIREIYDRHLIIYIPTMGQCMLVEIISGSVEEKNLVLYNCGESLHKHPFKLKKIYEEKYRNK
jgi:hypothetical protein